MTSKVMRRPLRALLALGLLAAWAGPIAPAARAQTAPKKKADAKKPAAKDQAKEKAAEPPPRESTGPEIFRDPRAKALLDNNFDQLFRNMAVQNDGQFRTMAEKAQPDPKFLQQYVQFQAKELTRHDNIEAMLDPEGTPAKFKALEDVTERLTVALEVANVRKNASFRKELVKAMTAPGVGDALLKNHLYARTQYMIALAASGEPLALDTFLGVLASKEQPAVLKLLAARGISKVIGGGARVDAIDVATRIRCAKAISDFLKAEPDSIWPVLDQALETLGALRQESYDAGRGDLEFLATAMAFLARPDAAVDVRSRAAWAIGMMRINANVRVNYPLMAYHMGHVATDLADRTLADFDPAASDPNYNEPAKDWAAQLVTRVVYGLKGDPKLGDSGLAPLAVRGARGDDRKAVDDVTGRAVDLGKAAVTLLQSAGGLRAQEKANLAKANAELRAYLAKNAPKDVALFPRGPEFPPAATGGAGGERAATKAAP